MLKTETLIIGVGNCGCKIAKKMWEKDYETLFINGSEQDLQFLGREVPSRLIKKLKGFDGFGGDRKKAVDCLMENIEVVESLQSQMQEIVFLITSGAGSTGSGLTAYIAEVLAGGLDENDEYSKFYNNRIIVPIVCFPHDTESIAKKRNAYQLAKELMEMEQINSIIFVDNNTKLYKDEGYEGMNQLLADSLALFLADNSVGEKNNFDTAEKKAMLREPGAFIFCLSKAEQNGQAEKEALLSSIKAGSVFAAIEKDGVCGNIAVLHQGETNEDITIDEVASVVGEPLNSFEGYNSEHTLIVVSGLSYPMTMLNKIGQAAKEGQTKRKEKRKNLEFTFENLEDEFKEDEEPVVKINKKSTNKSSLSMLKSKMENRK